MDPWAFEEEETENMASSDTDSINSAVLPQLDITRKRERSQTETWAEMRKTRTHPSRELTPRTDDPDLGTRRWTEYFSRAGEDKKTADDQRKRFSELLEDGYKIAQEVDRRLETASKSFAYVTSQTVKSTTVVTDSTKKRNTKSATESSSPHSSPTVEEVGRHKRKKCVSESTSDSPPLTPKDRPSACPAKILKVARGVGPLQTGGCCSVERNNSNVHSAEKTFIAKTKVHVSAAPTKAGTHTRSDTADRNENRKLGSGRQGVGGGWNKGICRTMLQEKPEPENSSGPQSAYQYHISVNSIPDKMQLRKPPNLGGMIAVKRVSRPNSQRLFLERKGKLERKERKEPIQPPGTVTRDEIAAIVRSEMEKTFPDLQSEALPPGTGERATPTGMLGFDLRSRRPTRDDADARAMDFSDYISSLLQDDVFAKAASRLSQLSQAPKEQEVARETEPPVTRPTVTEEKFPRLVGVGARAETWTKPDRAAVVREDAGRIRPVTSPLDVSQSDWVRELQNISGQSIHAVTKKDAGDILPVISPLVVKYSDWVRERQEIVGMISHAVPRKDDGRIHPAASPLVVKQPDWVEERQEIAGRIIHVIKPQPKDTSVREEFLRSMAKKPVAKRKSSPFSDDEVWTEMMKKIRRRQSSDRSRFRAVSSGRRPTGEPMAGFRQASLGGAYRDKLTQMLDAWPGRGARQKQVADRSASIGSKWRTMMWRWNKGKAEEDVFQKMGVQMVDAFPEMDLSFPDEKGTVYNTRQRMRREKKLQKRMMEEKRRQEKLEEGRKEMMKEAIRKMGKYTGEGKETGKLASKQKGKKTVRKTSIKKYAEEELEGSDALTGGSSSEGFFQLEGLNKTLRRFRYGKSRAQKKHVVVSQEEALEKFKDLVPVAFGEPESPREKPSFPEKSAFERALGQFAEAPGLKEKTCMERDEVIAALTTSGAQSHKDKPTLRDDMQGMNLHDTRGTHLRNTQGSRVDSTCVRSSLEVPGSAEAERNSLWPYNERGRVIRLTADEVEAILYYRNMRRQICRERGKCVFQVPHYVMHEFKRGSSPRSSEGRRSSLGVAKAEDLEALKAIKSTMPKGRRDSDKSMCFSDVVETVEDRVFMRETVRLFKVYLNVQKKFSAVPEDADSRNAELAPASLNESFNQVACQDITVARPGIYFLEQDEMTALQAYRSVRWKLALLREKHNTIDIATVEYQFPTSKSVDFDSTEDVNIIQMLQDSVKYNLRLGKQKKLLSRADYLCKKASKRRKLRKMRVHAKVVWGAIAFPRSLNKTGHKQSSSIGKKADAFARSGTQPSRRGSSVAAKSRLSIPESVIYETSRSQSLEKISSVAGESLLPGLGSDTLEVEERLSLQRDSSVADTVPAFESVSLEDRVCPSPQTDSNVVGSLFQALLSTDSVELGGSASSSLQEVKLKHSDYEEESTSETTSTKESSTEMAGTSIYLPQEQGFSSSATKEKQSRPRKERSLVYRWPSRESIKKMARVIRRRRAWLIKHNQYGVTTSRYLQKSEFPYYYSSKEAVPVEGPEEREVMEALGNFSISGSSQNGSCSCPSSGVTTAYYASLWPTTRKRFVEPKSSSEQEVSATPPRRKPRSWAKERKTIEGMIQPKQKTVWMTSRESKSAFVALKKLRAVPRHAAISLEPKSKDAISLPSPRKESQRRHTVLPRPRKVSRLRGSFASRRSDLRRKKSVPPSPQKSPAAALLALEGVNRRGYIETRSDIVAMPDQRERVAVDGITPKDWVSVRGLGEAVRRKDSTDGVGVQSQKMAVQRSRSANAVLVQSQGMAVQRTVSAQRVLEGSQAQEVQRNSSADEVAQGARRRNRVPAVQWKVSTGELFAGVKRRAVGKIYSEHGTLARAQGRAVRKNYSEDAALVGVQRRAVGKIYSEHGTLARAQGRVDQKIYSEHGTLARAQRRAVRKNYSEDGALVGVQRRAVRKNYSEDAALVGVQRRAVKKIYSEDGAIVGVQRRAIRKNYSDAVQRNVSAGKVADTVREQSPGQRVQRNVSADWIPVVGHGKATQWDASSDRVLNLSLKEAVQRYRPKGGVRFASKEEAALWKVSADQTHKIKLRVKSHRTSLEEEVSEGHLPAVVRPSKFGGGQETEATRQVKLSEQFKVPCLICKVVLPFKKTAGESAEVRPCLKQTSSAKQDDATDATPGPSAVPLARKVKEKKRDHVAPKKRNKQLASMLREEVRSRREGRLRVAKLEEVNMTGQDAVKSLFRIEQHKSGHKSRRWCVPVQRDQTMTLGSVLRVSKAARTWNQRDSGRAAASSPQPPAEDGGDPKPSPPDVDTKPEKT